MIYVNAFTARAITSPITVREISDCTAMVSFAHGIIGMTSVGLNAVLVVMPSPATGSQRTLKSQSRTGAHGPSSHEP